MQKELGIDLGTNSLGWGIVESNTVKDCGVLVFEQGIPQEKGREAALSPAAERTAFRAARRLKFRRRLRKYHTLKILIEQGMCPLALEELNRWIRQGVFPRGNENFIHWLNSTKERNPYPRRNGKDSVTGFGTGVFSYRSQTGIQKFQKGSGKRGLPGDAIQRNERENQRVETQAREFRHYSWTISL